MKLTLPFNKSMMLCGYKVNPYKEYWGYPHYGIDISAKEANGNMYVLASGDGEVLESGRDNSLGGGIAILYKDCEDRKGNKADLVARYMHLSAINVKKGDVVKRGQVIGYEGKEGAQDEHLHLEFDTDTKYPAYSPQVSDNHTFWRKGVDTTVNPSLFLHIGEGQELVTPIYNPAWLNAEDFDIPDVKEEKDMSELIKLPINENIPLETEDGYDAHGEPVWAWLKKGKWLYIFDKYWRKIPTKSSDYSGEFATEEIRKEAWEATVSEKATITEDITDFNEYDDWGEVTGDKEEAGNNDGEIEKEEVYETTTASMVFRILAEAFDEIADILE